MSTPETEAPNRRPRLYNILYTSTYLVSMQLQRVSMQLWVINRGADSWFRIYLRLP